MASSGRFEPVSCDLCGSGRSAASRKLADQALGIFGVVCALGGSGKALIVSARK